MTSGVSRRSLEAAVPGTVVAFAVAVVLAVRLVVLVVVRHQVSSVNPSCAVMKLTLAYGLRAVPW